MAAQDRIPDRLGPYRLRERIGEGGMGAVYLARDRERRMVAVKVLHSRVAEEPTARRRSYYANPQEDAILYRKSLR